MTYYIHKQLIPVDINNGDPMWAKRQIWVLKLNPDDEINVFDTKEEAEIKAGQLFASDPTQRIYKVVTKNDDGTWSDVA